MGQPTDVVAMAQELGRKVADLMRILDVTRSLNQTLDVEMQLQTIQDVATQLTETEAASIFLQDSKTDELFFPVRDRWWGRRGSGGKAQENPGAPRWQYCWLGGEDRRNRRGQRRAERPAAL